MSKDASLRDRATAVEPVPVSPLRDGIPSAVIEKFCDGLQEPLERVARKLSEEVYSDLLYNVQDYLKSNAVFNINSAFDASERDRIMAWRCLEAVLASASLQEAKANARAGQRGYWTPERASEYRAQAIEARRAETGTGSVHESAVRQDAPEGGQ